MCFSQKVYFKSIDSQSYNDSLTQAIDSFSELRISIHFGSYWGSLNDTVHTKPNLYWNSTSHVYKKNGIYLQQFVSPFIVTKPEIYKRNAINFFRINDSALFGTDFRPNETDVTYGNFDSVLYQEMIKMGITDDKAREHATTMNIPISACMDCPYVTIEIRQGNKEVSLHFSESLEFDSENEYYEFNSKLDIYPFYLLLKQEHQEFTRNAEYRLDQDDSSTLTKKESIEWTLKKIPSRIKDLRQMRNIFKSELKKMEE